MFFPSGRYLAHALIFYSVWFFLMLLVRSAWPVLGSLSLAALFFLVLFFFILTVVFHYFLTTGHGNRPQQFVRNFMAGTAARMIIHLGMLVILTLLNRDLAIPLILCYAATYLYSMVFEVYGLMRFFRGKRQSPSPKDRAE